MTAKTKKKQTASDAEPKSSTASPASVIPRSEGQRLLIAVPGSHSEVALAIEGTKQAVSYWRRGEKNPGPAARAKLRATFGIEPGAWETAVQSDAPAEPPEDERARAPRGTTTTLEEVQAELDYLYELRRNAELLPSARVRISDSIGKNLAIKARLERDHELLEDRIVREHAAWQKIRTVIRTTLTPYPEAAEAIAKALAGLETA